MRQEQQPASLLRQPPVVESALVMKMNRLVHLTEEEIVYLEGLQTKTEVVNAGTDLLVEGEDFRSTFIVQSGWAIRYRILRDGRRQITSILLPGDFIGLNVNFRRTANYSVAALTPLDVALVEPTRILEIQQRYPILASALSWATVRDFVILTEHVVRLGRRTAFERTGHLMLELYRRLELVKQTKGNSFTTAMTQTDLADMLGLSVVHVNRCLRKLREADLVTIDNATNTATVDLSGLEQLADNPDAFLEDFAVL